MTELQKMSKTTDKSYIPLPDRGLIKIEGPDARDYLQGLVSQDMERVTAETAVYSAFLSPQGRFLFDFFVFEMAGVLMLDCEGPRRSDLFKRLSMYKLRSDVELSDVTDDFRIYGVLDTLNFTKRGECAPFGDGVAYVDPRMHTMGCRVVLPGNNTSALDEAGLIAADTATYEHRRIELGLADGSRDMKVDRALLLENGFEELDGVDFSKGCFMGQELTARTRYRGLVKKRLLPVKIDGVAPENGAVFELDGREAGEMRTSSENMGLALVRLDTLQDGVRYTSPKATLTPIVPDWVVFQNPDSGDA